jgi:hypothetical protein
MSSRSYNLGSVRIKQKTIRRFFLKENQETANTRGLKSVIAAFLCLLQRGFKLRSRKVTKVKFPLVSEKVRFALFEV